MSTIDSRENCVLRAKKNRVRNPTVSEKPQAYIDSLDRAKSKLRFNRAVYFVLGLAVGIAATWGVL